MCNVSEVEISQPMFTPSVGGYSSYLAYPINANDMVKTLEAQFHFSTGKIISSNSDYP